MTEASPVPPSRLPALDWLRGLVMLVMTVDHADSTFNHAHAMGDSAMRHQGFPLSPPDFLTRWSTHLCAPSFFFLAGAGIALSAANARRRGQEGWRLDVHLLLRGAVLVAFDLLWISAAFGWMRGGRLLWMARPSLQVLYALGVGMALMGPLRRLPSWVLLVVAGVVLGGSELVCGWMQSDGFVTPWWSATTFNAGFTANGVFVLYPAVPWLPAMLLGFVLGRRLASGADCTRLLLLSGLGALGLFVVLRGIDGYGNMDLHRRSLAVLEWLHCSKYPPSVTYLLMELGLMAVLLAGCFWLQARVQQVATWNPLLVIGQVPLFFYLLHLWVIGVWRRLGAFEPGSHWPTSWLAAGVTVLALWPLCGAYRWYKQTYRHAWTRYV